MFLLEVPVLDISMVIGCFSKSLIHKCWDGERGRRPPFKEILGMLEEIKEELPQNEPHTLHFLHHSHHSPKVNNDHKIIGNIVK